ncbi:MAG TPA: SDR family oxidoreductase [Burkholderiaceae bacterium]|nr:SDR family oxidoreductase [Burkholderiaceae bacterium]
MALRDKVVLVTGAAQGIGQATALALARAGARVVVSDRDDRHAAEQLAALERCGAEAHFVRADVMHSADCTALVDAALARFGRLDCAVNNAGVSEGPPPRPLADYPDALWEHIVGVNLGGVFRCMREELRAMRDGGHGGAIVNIASVAGQIAFAGVAGYVASKHGVVGLTKAAAVDYGALGIRCNAIGPGFIDTRMLPPQAHDWMRSVTPAGRLGSADEIAQAAVWLCSDAASFVNGAYLAADGGFLAQ